MKTNMLIIFAFLKITSTLTSVSLPVRSGPLATLAQAIRGKTATTSLGVRPIPRMNIVSTHIHIVTIQKHFLHHRTPPLPTGAAIGACRHSNNVKNCQTIALGLGLL